MSTLVFIFIKIILQTIKRMATQIRLIKKHLLKENAAFETFGIFFMPKIIFPVAI
jgi:hypothetical protein